MFKVDLEKEEILIDGKYSEIYKELAILISYIKNDLIQNYGVNTEIVNNDIRNAIEIGLKNYQEVDII